jgi:hypothetical protein
LPAGSPARQVLLEQIRSERIAGRPQVLPGRHPDEGVRYDQVRRDFPELIYEPPRWVHTEAGNWAHVFPLAEDVALLANVTAHADLNVNFGSTMTPDFALHDKPVVTPAFDVIMPPVFGMSLYDFCTQFEHYRPVADLGAARFARSENQLAEYINAYLKDPSLDRAARRALVSLHVQDAPGFAARKIIDTLARIARPDHADNRTAAEPVRQFA